MGQQLLATMQPSSEDEPQPEKRHDPAAPMPVARESVAEPVVPLGRFRAEAEIMAIQSALKYTGWNRKQAARLLKISYRGLLYKIRRHNIIQS